MQQYANVAFLNAGNDFRLLLYDLKDKLLTCSRPSPPCGGVYFPWRFHLASHGYSCSPDFPVKLPKGFTGSCCRVSWVSFLASGGTFPHGPCICPCYLLFQRQPSLSLNTCQTLHICFFLFHFDITGHCGSSSRSLEVLILPAPTSLMSSSWS